MTGKRIIFFLVGFLLLAPPVALALEIPPNPSARVNDYAGVLAEPVKADLENRLAAFESETSNQIVVAIFNSLEGGSLEDFSIRLAEKWKIGQKGKDNGVILLIFMQDRQVRIEVGYGLEGALPDVTADRIIRNEIVPAFRAGEAEKGISAATNAIMQALKGEYQSPESKADPLEKYSPLIFVALILYFTAPLMAYFMVLAVPAFLFGLVGFLWACPAVFFLFMLRKFFAQSLMGGTTISPTRRGRGGWSSGGFGGGFGGGGFGGGGGGSFGGGGASGRW